MIREIPEWFDPGQVVWVDQPGRKRMLERRAADPNNTHLLRECETRIATARRPHNPPTANDLWSLVDRATGEFSVLARHGIQVPEVRWHVTHIRGMERLIARVAIVDGILLENLRFEPGYSQHHNQLQGYKKDHSPGHRLSDAAEDSQCIVGWQRALDNPRTDTGQSESLWMIDLDLYEQGNFVGEIAA